MEFPSTLLKLSDILIRFVSEGGAAVEADFNRIGDAAKRNEDDIQSSVKNMNRMQAFEGIANAGNQLSDMGGKALSLADNWSKVSEEGRGIEQRLESMLKAQNRLSDLDKIDAAVQDVTVRGHFDDDDEIRNAAVLMGSFSVKTGDLTKMLELSARQARTMGVEVGNVATQLGKAYSTGNIAALKRAGFVFTEQEMAAVKAAYKISSLAGQQKFLEVVTKSVTNNTVDLNNSLTETQARANDVARGWDDLQTSLGKGSAEAKASFQGIIAGILDVSNASPKMVEAAGAMTYFAGAAGSAAGPVLTMVGNLGQAAAGAQALGWTSKATFATIAAGAGTAALAVAALTVAIYGTIKAYQGLADAQMDDESLVKKHGTWGKIWSEGGKFVGDSKLMSYTPVGWAAGNRFWDRNTSERVEQQLRDIEAKKRLRYPGRGTSKPQPLDALAPFMREPAPSASMGLTTNSSGTTRARGRATRNTDGSVRITFDPVTVPGSSRAARAFR